MMDGQDSLLNRLDQLYQEQTRNENPAGHNIQDVAQYRIGRVLGSGGFGVVYLAEDTELNRHVALKLPRLEALFDQEKRRRFAAEAMTAARLNHPGIVKVYEANLDGLMPFIASEFCDGPNLAEWLKAIDHLPAWQDCVELVADVADAVEYAHGHQVFHRDLKPANIIITLKTSPPIEQRRAFANWNLKECDARLTDFGLAKLVDSGMTTTRTSQMMGTPLYMAPEQLEQGDSQRSNAEIDVYSLGVVLFELLTRSMPINGSSYINALDNIRTMSPRRLSESRDGLPRDLEKICRKCLEKNPAARYSSAKALSEDLRRCAEQLPILGASESIWSRFDYWSTRPQRVSTLGWYVISWTLIVAFWMTFNVCALPFHSLVSRAEMLESFRDLGLVVVAAVIPVVWFGWKTVNGKSWAVWTLLVYSIFRVPLLMKAMVMPPVYFTMIYRDNPLFSFVDHSMMFIATCIQLFLCVCAIRAKKNSIETTAECTSS